MSAERSEYAKVATDIRFYFLTGLVLYTVNFALYLIDLYQRYGQDPVGYTGLAVFYIINISLLTQLRRLNNWGRTLFMVKFVVFALFFYPQMFYLQSGSYMYSHHFPHGVLQRISNFGDIAYELLLLIYLLKRSVRYAFTHR